MIHVEVHRDSVDAVAEFKISVTTDSIAGFKQMVAKALNCWPDAPPELKEMGDMLDHGKILQDYYHTRSDLKKA